MQWVMLMSWPLISNLAFTIVATMQCCSVTIFELIFVDLSLLGEYVAT
jgi:uncharacterized membrane protein